MLCNQCIRPVPLVESREHAISHPVKRTLPPFDGIPLAVVPHDPYPPHAGF